MTRFYTIEIQPPASAGMLLAGIGRVTVSGKAGTLEMPMRVDETVLVVMDRIATMLRRLEADAEATARAQGPVHLLANQDLVDRLREDIGNLGPNCVLASIVKALS